MKKNLKRILQLTILPILLLIGVNGWGQISESFESGLPTSYNDGTYTLSSGDWVLTNCKQITSGVQTGTYAAAIGSTTGSNIITPPLVGGVGTLTLYASASSTGNFQVNISTDGTTFNTFTSFTGLTSSVSIYSIVLNNPNIIKIQIKRTSGVIYIDDFSTTVYSIPDLVISEVADPLDNYLARFIEIYNASNTTIDLSTYSIRIYSNGSGTVSSTVSLSGAIAPTGFYTVARSTSDFNAAFSFNPDVASGNIDGNGNDVYELFDGFNVVDVYGVVGVDGDTTSWKYTDMNAIRTSDSKGASKGNATFTVSEWSIATANVADCTPGALSTGQDGALLPINIVSFSAELQDNGILLNWTTATEINNSHFTIERSYDGKDFYEIGTMEGAGNSNQILDYSFVDESKYSNTLYYRLKQTDFDGISTYSEMIQLNASLGTQNLTNLYLNDNQMILEVVSPLASSAAIQIYAADGRIILNEELQILKGNGKYSVAMPNTASGLYFINLVSGYSVITKKIFIP